MNIFSCRALAAIAVIWACAVSLEAGTITIDRFDAPDPSQFFLTYDNTTSPPTAKERVLVKTLDTGILGGERDILLEVAGTASAISASILVGADQGLLSFGTAGDAGTMILLQYDGIDTGDSESLNLDDAMGLSADLTDGGLNDSLVFSFSSLDAGNPPKTEMSLSITAVGTVEESTVTSTYAGMVEESTDFDFVVPFDEFSGGTAALTNLKSLTITFNGEGTPTPNAEFTLDSIVAVPEPATWSMLVGIAACLSFLAVWRRR